jgi:hypothetical protein
MEKRKVKMTLQERNERHAFKKRNRYFRRLHILCIRVNNSLVNWAIAYTNAMRPIIEESIKEFNGMFEKTNLTPK